MYTEEEFEQAQRFLESLQRYNVPFYDLAAVVEEAMNLTIQHAYKVLGETTSTDRIETYLADGHVKPGIVYDGMRILPVAYHESQRPEIEQKSYYLISVYPILPYFAH